MPVLVGGLRGLLRSGAQILFPVRFVDQRAVRARCGLGERRTFNEFQDERVHGTAVLESIDRADVRMIERGPRTCASRVKRATGDRHCTRRRAGSSARRRAAVSYRGARYTCPMPPAPRKSLDSGTVRDGRSPANAAASWPRTAAAAHIDRLVERAPRACSCASSSDSTSRRRLGIVPTGVRQERGAIGGATASTDS
jgi:hypothetical protein